MANIELNIVALGDFTSVNNQIIKLKEQVSLLNTQLGGASGSALDKAALSVGALSKEFNTALTASGAFTKQNVLLQTETEKFGQSLQKGTLGLGNYYKILKKQQGEALTSVKALALEQTKLQNSVIMSDPTKSGFYSVMTPKSIDSIANATKIAANEQNIYNIALKQGTNQLINWGKNTQWAGRQLTVGMSMPLILFGSTATKVFKEVNDQLVRLQKVYGTGLTQPTQATLDAIKTQVVGLSKELAASMGIAAKDTAAMAADLAATGKTGNDLLGATREAMRLSKLGEMDTQQAMQTTISLQNVYKLNTEQLSGAVNFLNAVENQTSTSLQDLAAGIPKVGPIVQQLGGSFKDTAVMMVAMKEAGVPAAQSANAIKSALSSLINPSKSAKDAFAAFNINLAGIATSTKGNPIKMIMQLQDALKGLAPLAQAQLIEKLFGKFQEARIQALITNLGAANSQTKTAFDLMNANSSQLAAVAANEMKTATESVTGKYQRAMETFKADLIPVGQKLMQIATSLLNFGNSVSKLFDGLPGPVKNLLGAIAVGVALSGPIIMLTGLLANFVGFLIKGIFNIRQLATGGKTLGQLLTPELIAAQNASSIFASGLSGDVDQVHLLTNAITELTARLTLMREQMVMGAGIGNLASASAATVEASVFRQMSLPGFADGKESGKIVKGPGTGKSDSILAKVSNGEAILPEETVNNNKQIIDSLLKTGTFEPKIDLTGGPGNADRSSASVTGTQRLIAGMPGLRQLTPEEIAAKNERARAQIQANQLRASSLAFSQQYNGNVNQSDLVRGHISENEEGGISWLLGSHNQRTKLNSSKYTNNNPISGPELAAGLEATKNMGIHPFSPMMASAARLGATDMPNASKQLDDALNHLIESLKTTDKTFGGAGESFEKFASKIVDPYKANIPTQNGASNLAADHAQVQTIRSSGGRSGGTKEERFSWGNIPAEYHNSTTANLMGTPDGGSKLSDKYGVKTTAFMNEQLALSGQKDAEQVSKSYQAAIKTGLLAKIPNVQSQAEEYIKNNVEGAVGTGINQAAQSASPSKEIKQATQNMVDGALVAIEDAKPKIQSAMDQAIQPTLGGMENTNLNISSQKENLVGPVMSNGGFYTDPASARMSKMAKQEEKIVQSSEELNVSRGKLSRVTGKITDTFTKENGKLTAAGKAGIGTAFMMGGQMLGSMLPQGSTAGKMASTTANYAGMGMMFGPEGAAIGASIGLLVSAFQIGAENQRAVNNTLKSSYSVSTQAAQQFGLNFQALQNYDFAKTANNLSAHQKSISENKAAIDRLTQSYKDAADQQTKDYITKVGGADATTLKAMMQEKYSTDRANGLNNQQAMQDVTSIMQAAGQSALAISRVQQKISQPDSTKQAFQQVVKNSLTDTSTGKKFAAGDGRTGDLKFQNLQKSVQDDLTLLQNSINSYNQAAKDYPSQATNYKAKAKEQQDKYNALLNSANPEKSTTAALPASTVTALQTAITQLISGPAKNLSDSFDHLKGSAEGTMINNTAVFDALDKQIKSTVPELGKYTNKIKGTASQTQSLAEAQQIYQIAVKGGLTSFSALTAAMNKGPAAIDKLFKSLDWSKLGGQKVDDKGNVTPTVDTYATPAAFTGTTQEKELLKKFEGMLSAQNAQLKIVKDQLSLQQKLSQEAKAQLQYQQQITGLQNDMKTAMISGNYLQAATFKQQISGAKVDFNATQVSSKLQDQIDKMQPNADAINQALADLKDLIGNSKTVVPASILAATKLGNIKAQAAYAGGVGGNAPTVTTIIQLGDGSTVTSTSTQSSHPGVKPVTKVVPKGSKITAGKTIKTGVK